MAHFMPTQPYPLGIIKPTAPGTEKQISATITRAYAIIFQAMPANTKPVYLGLFGMVPATGVGVICWVLPAMPPVILNIEKLGILDPRMLYVDGEIQDEGALVSLLGV